MSLAVEDPLARVLAMSREEVRAHSALLAWRDALDARIGVAWIPARWARDTPCAREAAWLPAPVRAGLASPDPSAAARAGLRAGDLVGLAVAILDLDPSCDPSQVQLCHTPLGQPCVSLTGRARGRWPEGLHLSYSHDGPAHVAVVAADAGLVGLGVDILRIGRLMRPGRGEGHVRRLARRVMSNEEHGGFAAASEAEGLDSLTRRAGIHFSLMEAASKALGTGLRLGIGIGRPGSLPPAAIGVSALESPVEFILAKPAELRLDALGGTGGGRLEGHWAADSEHIMTFAAAWRNEVAR